VATTAEAVGKVSTNLRRMDRSGTRTPSTSW
jgi:hypothetical protein